MWQMGVLSTLVSFLLGILTSAVLWVFRTRVIVPKIEWSERVACETDTSLPGTLKQSVKVKNVGRRAMVVGEIVCILSVPITGSGKSLLCQLPTMGVPIPKLGPGETRTITLKTYGFDEEQIFRFPNSILQVINQTPPRPLRDVLDAQPNSEIRVHLSAYDELSGTRRNFLAGPYVSSDLGNGHFAPKSIRFIPD